MSSPEDRLPEEILRRRARVRDVRDFLICFCTVLALILIAWRMF